MTHAWSWLCLAINKFLFLERTVHAINQDLALHLRLVIWSLQDIRKSALHMNFSNEDVEQDVGMPNDMKATIYLFGSRNWVCHGRPQFVFLWVKALVWELCKLSPIIWTTTWSNWNPRAHHHHKRKFIFISLGFLWYWNGCLNLSELQLRTVLTFSSYGSLQSHHHPFPGFFGQRWCLCDHDMFMTIES